MKRIIVIARPQGSGKTTLANKLIEGVQAGIVYKFARPIYRIHNDICRELDMPVDGRQKDRELLQFLGTFIKQKTANPQYFSKRWELGVSAEPTRATLVADDLRFPDELAAAKRVGAICVRLYCPESIRQERIGSNFGGAAHESETALEKTPDSEFDFVFWTGNMSPAAMAEMILTGVAG